VAQLNVRLNEERLQALRRYALRRRTPVSWLIQDYVDFLIAGGEPVRPADEGPTAMDVAGLAQRGGALDWLADEPDLYTDEDGEPV
jgi:hypothetical protein